MKVYGTVMFVINRDQAPGDKYTHPPQDFACEHLFALFYKPTPFPKLTCR